jgi:hypothetical protein
MEQCCNYYCETLFSLYNIFKKKYKEKDLKTIYKRKKITKKNINRSSVEW